MSTLAYFVQKEARAKLSGLNTNTSFNNCLVGWLVGYLGANSIGWSVVLRAESYIINNIYIKIIVYHLESYLAVSRFKNRKIILYQ